MVKVYGSMSGLKKLTSKMCSPGTSLKFDDAIKELTNLAKQVREGEREGERGAERERERGCCCPCPDMCAAGSWNCCPSATPASPGCCVQQSAAGCRPLAAACLLPPAPLLTRGGAAGRAALQARLQRQQPTRMGTAHSSALDSARMPSSVPTALAGVGLATSGSNSHHSTVQAVPSIPTSPMGVGSSTASATTSGLPMLAEQAPVGGSGQGSSGLALMGDRQVPEEALMWKKVRKGGSRQAITAMLHVPPGEHEPQGHLGYLWYYLSK